MGGFGRSSCPAPIFFGLTPHRRRCRILDLEPVIDPSRAVRRAEPLRDDAFATKRAGVLVDAGAVADEVLPSWDSDEIAWPVPQPDFAATFAASMPVSRDIRHSADWWKASVADAAERRQLAERRAAEQHAADAAARAEYERTLLKNQEERERRAQEARRRA